LLLLRHGSAHGYTLLDQLAEFGLAERNPSTIYRVLRDMEGRGYVTSVWEEVQTQGPPRRVYQLTAQGQEMLAQHACILDETRGLIDRFLSTYRAQVPSKSPGNSPPEGRSENDSAV
jgi:PadR family transcriptional regulator PadR